MEGDVVVSKHQRPDEEHAHGPCGQGDHRLELLVVEVPTHRGLHPSSRAATARSIIDGHGDVLLVADSSELRTGLPQNTTLAAAKKRDPVSSGEETENGRGRFAFAC